MNREEPMILPNMEMPSPSGNVSEMLVTKGNVVHSITPEATVYEAIERMDELRVGALVVMDADRRLHGIISERDYTRKVILLGRSSRETRVDEIMTSSVVSVTPSTSLGECLNVVTELRIRHLPVVESGRVVGMLSIGDLVRAVLGQQAETIQTLNSFIGGDYPQ
jgi:CBS domain-containing protein